MTQTTTAAQQELQTSVPAPVDYSQPEPKFDDVSEMSAAISDLEPETTATAIRN